MNKHDIENCKRRLEATRRELLSDRTKTEGIAIQRVPDSMEELTLEIERNMTVDTLNRKAALFGQVSEALKRIAEGRYGVCLTCQTPISLKRLAALPWAALCLQCQQTAESRLLSEAVPSMSLWMELTA